jgi:hypothetical protein
MALEGGRRSLGAHVYGWIAPIRDHRGQGHQQGEQPDDAPKKEADGGADQLGAILFSGRLSIMAPLEDSVPASAGQLG